MTPPVPTPVGPGPRLFRAESVGSALGLYLPSIVVARFVGLLRGVILAWLISEGEFGLLQIALLAINILHPLCSAGLNEAVVRYVPQYETRRGLRPFLARVVPLVLGVTAVLSAAVLLAAEPLGRFLFATLQRDGAPAAVAGACPVLTRLAAGATFALIAYFLLLSVLKGLRMFRAISLMELVNSVAFTLLAVVAAVGGWRTAGAVLACYGAVLIGMVLVFSPPLARVVHGAGDGGEAINDGGVSPRGWPLVEQMVRFSVWAAMAAVLWQALLCFPMWYLHKMCGQQGEVTAVFGGVRLLAQAVLIGAVAVVAVVQASVTKTWESRGSAQADRQLGVAFKAAAVLLIVACAILAASRRLLICMFPASYAGGAAVIPILLLFFLVSGHLSFLAIHFHLIEKPRHLLLPWLMGLVCGVAAGRWLVRPNLAPEAALQAAAWVGVLGVSAALVTCLCLILVERRPLDSGAWVLIVATYAVALPIHLLVPVVAAGVALAAGTNVVFTRDEKRRLGEQAAAGRERIRRVLAMTRT